MGESRVCGMLALSVGMTVLGAVSALAASGDWKPDRVVEIVVNTSAGASPDRTARAMQRIFQERKQLDVPVTVQNRVGGAGAVAYTYLNTKHGATHTAMAGTTKTSSTYKNDKGVTIALQGTVKGVGLGVGGGIATVELIKQ